MNRLEELLHRPKQPRRHALILLLTFSLALVGYNIIAGAKYLQQSLAPHYIYLAEAFNQGRLEISEEGNQYDLIIHDGKQYLASPPMPAVLLMPLVAKFGVQFSDVLFSTFVGAINVLLVQGIFRRGWLTLLFALGTPHLYLSALGSVWFQAQGVAILFALLALLFALRWQNPFLSGLCWGCAVLARPPLLFGGLFLLLIFWQFGRSTSEHAPILRPAPRPFLSRYRHALVLITLTLGTAVILLGSYNWARFGSFSDFGYSEMLSAPNIVRTIAQYGTFHLRFLPCNLYVALFALPVFQGETPPMALSLCGYLLDNGTLSLPPHAIQPNPFGLSLFVATPAFLLLLTQWREKWLWLTLLLVMLPNLLLHNTGSLQFGYRYWLDATPIWLLLLWLAWQEARWRRIGRYLILLSLVMHLWGYAWIYRQMVGHFWGAWWF